MKRSIRFAIFLSAILPVAACVTEDEGEAAPLDGLRFPTGLAMAEEPGGRSLLFVTSSNADLRYRSGALHVFDLAAIDALADGAMPPSDCPTGPDGLPVRCRTPDVPDLGPARIGEVEIGNFSGQVAVTPLGDGLRAFVPIRDGDAVIAVDVPGGGAPVCAAGGGARCPPMVAFPADDPDSVRVIGGTVYVTNVGFDADGYLGLAAPDDAIWSGGGKLPAIRLGKEAAGGIAAACAPVAAGAPECSSGGTLFISGRSFSDAFSPIYLLDIPAGGPAVGPVTTLDLFSEQRGLDSRGIQISGDGNSLYLATRHPDALATLDVQRIRTADEGSCVVVPPVPEDFRCPDTGGQRPVVINVGLVATSKGPGQLAVIARELPGGGTSDLVLLTTQDGLDFVDTRTGVLAARITEVGSAPSSVVVRPGGGSYRIYVTSYGRGTLAVVDLADPFRPDLARVVARLGKVQEGSF